VALEKDGLDQFSPSFEKRNITLSQGETKIVHTIKWKKANWNVHILRGKCLLKHIFEGRIESLGRRERRRKQLQNDLKERTGFCKLKEEAQDCTCWGPLGKALNLSYGRKRNEYNATLEVYSQANKLNATERTTKVSAITPSPETKHTHTHTHTHTHKPRLCVKRTFLLRVNTHVQYSALIH
jgi:hypothetical protein